MINVSIIIPVYNEVKFIEDVLHYVNKIYVKGFKFEVIVVESNSTDGTKDLVKKFQQSLVSNKNKHRFYFIYQKKPMGKGNAVREGLNKATGDLILIQDSDLEYSFSDYKILLTPFLKDRDLSLVVGKRARKSFGRRKFGNFGLRSSYFNFGEFFFHRLFKILYQSKIDDPTSMFKIFKRKYLSRLKLESNRFDLDWEIICKLSLLKLPYLEIEVNYNSRGFSEGKKVLMFKDPVIWIYKIFKYRFFK